MRGHKQPKENVMRKFFALGLAMLVGAAGGAAAVSGLNAQTKAPGAYAVIDISEVTNPETFKALLAKAEAPVLAAGGNFVIRSEKITARDGVAPARFVVIAFDSMEKAKLWDRLPAQKEIDDMRAKSAKARSFIVDGSVN
jgi:uncharacterized protein (DUF1330 family)